MEENCDNNNHPILSSKKGPTCHKRSCCRSKRDSGPDPWRDAERLRATLEVERSRNQHAHRRFSLDLRRQREEAREERERALRELTYRHEQQKTLELLRQREALGRERAAEVRRLLRWRSREGKRAEKSTLRQTREVQRQLVDEIAGTGVQSLKPGCKGNGAAYRKLEELLKTLLAQADGQQVDFLQRLQQEVDLEKSYFLCHLLEAHSRPAQEDRKRRVAKLSRPRSKSCVQLLSGVEEGHLALFRSCSLSRSESPQPMKKKKKQDSESPPPGSSAAEEEESKGDLTLPESCSSDEPSEKCSTSRCSEDIMDDLVDGLQKGCCLS